jgi:AcrR family transcriptional regulator
MPLARFQRLSPERREQILAAARREFAEHGFEAASYNRIIESAGASKGAMYYYFADKADLFAAVMDDAVAAIGARVGPLRLEAVADAAAFWSALRGALDRALRVLAADRELAGLGRAFYQALPAAGRGGSLAPVVEATGRLVEDALGQGRRVGAVRDDLPADLLAAMATALAFAVDRWLAERWRELRPERLAALEEPLLDLFRRLVAPDPFASERSPS